MSRTLQFSGKAPKSAQPDDPAPSQRAQGQGTDVWPPVSVSGELPQGFRENQPSADTDGGGPLASAGQGSDLPWKPKEPGPFKEGDRFQNYRIIKEIGFGGYARVYHAFHEFLEVDLAIKVIHRQGSNPAELAARSKAEARFLQSVQSPYVVRVYEAGLTENNLLFIAMELLDGRSLRSILFKRRKLTWKMALPLFAKIAEGVQAAHTMNVIHRDLKPENIFVLRDGTPKVLDFGIAKFMDAPPITTRENLFHGTPPYMSPEQLSGRPMTVRSDIYALGLVLYEVLAGKHPMLEGENSAPDIIAYRNIYLHPPLLNEIDPTIYKPVARLVNRLIAKSPDQRPQSMTEVARELRTCFEKCRAAKRGFLGVLATGDTTPVVGPDPVDVDHPSQLLLDEPTPHFGQAPQTPPQAPVVAQNIAPEAIASRRPAADPIKTTRFEQPSTRDREAEPKPLRDVPTPARWKRIAVQGLVLSVGGFSIGIALVVGYMYSTNQRSSRTPAPAQSATPLSAAKVPSSAAPDPRPPAPPSSGATPVVPPSPVASVVTPPVAASDPKPAKSARRATDKSDRFVNALEAELKRQQAKSAAGASKPARKPLYE